LQSARLNEFERLYFKENLFLFRKAFLPFGQKIITKIEIWLSQKSEFNRSRKTSGEIDRLIHDIEIRIQVEHQLKIAKF
jgi:hypothetical protein